MADMELNDEKRVSIRLSAEDVTACEWFGARRREVPARETSRAPRGESEGSRHAMRQAQVVGLAALRRASPWPNRKDRISRGSLLSRFISTLFTNNRARGLP